jgi:tetratricopeptide (TPR) repeat protein
MNSETRMTERSLSREKIVPHLPLAAIVAAALAFRIAYILSIRHNPLFGPSLPGYDMTAFHEWAVRIAGGQLSDGRAFYQAPLYPYLLALVYRIFGPDPLAAAFFQAGLGSLTVLFAHGLGKRLFGGAAALWAAGFMAAAPIFPYYEGFLLRDSLATFLNVLFLWSLFRCDPGKPLRGAVLCGFLLGLAALARSNALVLLPVGALWLWFLSGGPVRRGSVVSALFLASAFLTVSPAALHTRLAGGQWALVEASMSQNWRIGNSFDSTGGYWEPKQGLVPPLSGAFLRLQLKKLGKLLSDYEEPNNMNFYHFQRYSRWLKVPLLSWGFFLAFGLAGAWLTRRRWRELWPLYGYVLLYGLSIAAFFVTSRFRLPLWPVAILFSGAALAAVWKYLEERRFAVVAAVLVPAALGAAALKAMPEKVIQAQYFQNAAMACEKAGRKTEELCELRDWAIMYPSDPNPLPALAQILFEQEDKRAALEATVRLTELRPAFARGWYGAGRLYYELKDKAMAAHYFRRWIELEPEAPEAAGIRKFLRQYDSSLGMNFDTTGSKP